MKDEDKTFENERKHMNEPVEDRGPLDLTLLTDQYREDLNKYKERESLYLKTENQLQGTKQIVINMSGTIRELTNHNKTLSQEIDRLNKYVEVLQKEK
jgi:phosphoenolpyruvate carboxylase